MSADYLRWFGRQVCGIVAGASVCWERADGDPGQRAVRQPAAKRACFPSPALARRPARAVRAYRIHLIACAPMKRSRRKRMTAETWDDAVTRLAGRPELHDAWLNGLAYNPAATGPVLSRIITVSQRLQHASFWLEHRELTQDAGVALARHPDRGIRLQLTEN